MNLQQNSQLRETAVVSSFILFRNHTFLFHIRLIRRHSFQTIFLKSVYIRLTSFFSINQLSNNKQKDALNPITLILNIAFLILDIAPKTFYNHHKFCPLLSQLFQSKVLLEFHYLKLHYNTLQFPSGNFS